MINEWASLLEIVEFKPIERGRVIHTNLQSIIMTGGQIHIKDNLLWCSPNHYALLKARQEKRYFLLDAENSEEVVGPMLRQTSEGIKYE